MVTCRRCLPFDLFAIGSTNPQIPELARVTPHVLTHLTFLCPDHFLSDSACKLGTAPPKPLDKRDKLPEPSLLATLGTGLRHKEVSLVAFYEPNFPVNI